MKFRLTFNIFLTYLFFTLFALTVFTQEKPKALKFDEFDDSVGNQFYSYFEKKISISERTERFIDQLKKERGVKVYIIYYQAEIISNSNNIIENRASRIIYEIQSKTQIKYEDVILVDGGYREKNTLEFWIAPKTAEPPAPTPTLDKSETFVCPHIYVYGDGLPFYETGIVHFSIPTYDLKSVEKPAFNWKVSAGKIVEGQGTSKIKVDLSNSDTKRITAFAEVGGLPLPCEKVGFSTIDVSSKAYQVDHAERYNYSDLAARLDSFMIMLNNNPTAKGYIIIYATRGTGAKDMERGITSVKNFFKFSKRDMSRITIVRGGFREYSTVDSWILFEGAEPPKPTPTVDKNFVITNPIKKTSTRKKS